MKRNSLVIAALILMMLAGVYVFQGRQDQAGKNHVAKKSTGIERQVVQEVASPGEFKEKLKNNRIAMLIMGAEWCHPCQQFRQGLQEQNFDLFPVFYAQVEKEPWKDFAGEYHLRGYPAMLFFKDGERFPVKSGTGETRFLILGPMTHEQLVAMDLALKEDRLPDFSIAANKPQANDGKKALHIEKIMDFKGHDQWVLDVRLHPDGRRFITVSKDGTARIWSIKEEKELHVLKGGKGSLTSVDIHPDGKLAATSGDDGEVRIWDVDTGALLHQLNDLKILDKQYPNAEVTFPIRFSPDGKYLAGTGPFSSINIWEVPSMALLPKLKGGVYGNRYIDFSPDGQYLAAGGMDTGVRIWSVLQPDPLMVLTGHENWVRSVQFSADGETLFSAGRDYKSHSWSWQSGKGKILAMKSKRCFRSLAVGGTEESRLLISGSYDGTVRVYDLETDKVIDELKFDLKKREGVARLVLDWPSHTMITVHVNGSVIAWSLPDYQLKPASNSKKLPEAEEKKWPEEIFSKERATPLAPMDLSKKILKINNEQEIVLVRIPDGESEFVDRKRKKIKVAIKGLWVAESELTKDQYRAILDKDADVYGSGDVPVTEMEFPIVEKLTQGLKKKTGMDLRLPSEGEWFYAARSGIKTLYPLGNTPQGIFGYAWTNKNSGLQPRGVKQLLPNAWGLYDMIGNVSELCFTGPSVEGSPGVYSTCGSGWNNTPENSNFDQIRRFSIGRSGVDVDYWNGMRLVYSEGGTKQ